MGVAAKIWATTLYNHALGSEVEYGIKNLEENKSSLTDMNADGFLKQKAKLEIGENENTSRG